MIIENNELIIDVDYDNEKFKVLCDMFDENDTGYTRAPAEVYLERFNDMLKSPKLDKYIEKNIEETILFINKNKIDRG